MALNIPLPGMPGQSFLQGVDTGSTLFQRMIQPYIAREQMKLAHQLDPFRAQLLQEQISNLQNENNPNYYQGLAESVLGKQASQTQTQPHVGVPLQQNQEYSPQSLQNNLFTAPQLSALNNVPNPNFKAPMQAPSGFLEDMNDDVGSIPEHTAREIEALPPAKNAVDELAKRLFIKKKFGIDLGKTEGGVLQGAAREAADLERVKQLYGENSPVYQMAKENYDLKEQRKEALIRKAEKEDQGLKPGQKYIYEDGQRVGYASQPSPEEKKEYKGRAFFNEVYPIINEGLSQYFGKGSIYNFGSDINSYNVDAAARARIDKFLLAKRLVVPAAVKEGATLSAPNTYRTFNYLLNSLDSSDIPEKIEEMVTQYGLPKSAALKTGEKAQALLNSATEKGNKSVPAFVNHYYDENRNKPINNSGTVPMQYGGYHYDIPADQVEGLLKEGFVYAD